MSTVEPEVVAFLFLPHVNNANPTLGCEEACRKAKYIKGASLAGGLSGTAGGAILGGYALGQICLAFVFQAARLDHLHA